MEMEMRFGVSFTFPATRQARNGERLRIADDGIAV